MAEHPVLGAFDSYGIFKTVSDELECGDRFPREELLLFWKIQRIVKLLLDKGRMLVTHLN